MFIQTEDTPNPATLKFLPGCVVMAEGTWDCPHPEGALSSPLARKLFEIEGVCGVFYGSDFITVTKQEEQAWFVIKPSVLAVLMEHFLTHAPLFEEGVTQEGVADDLDPLSLEIREILNARVRPAVAMDGGDIIFDHFKDGIVYVRLQGACSGCPSSTATLKAGIENMLRHYVPEVTGKLGGKGHYRPLSPSSASNGFLFWEVFRTTLGSLS